MTEARKQLKIWYDSEGDYLEVIFNQKPGYFRETENDQVMQKVDDEGECAGLLSDGGQRDEGEATRYRFVDL